MKKNSIRVLYYKQKVYKLELELPTAIFASGRPLIACNVDHVLQNFTRKTIERGLQFGLPSAVPLLLKIYATKLL
jgi:hypothetical protein